MFSDDEIDARIQRAMSRAEVDVPLALLTMIPVIDELIKAQVEFGEACKTLLDAALAGLTPAQREVYNQLVACGTPAFDALCEAEELAE